MKAKTRFSRSKLGILLVLIMAVSLACDRTNRNGPGSVIRFEELVLTTPPENLPDSLRTHHRHLLPFFRIFNEEIIRIGPDTLPGYVAQLRAFTRDSVISQVFAAVNEKKELYEDYFLEIDEALGRWNALTGYQQPDHLITFISGFNQSFITLPDCLCIGLDNYLGSESPFYRDLGIPAYLRNAMIPANLPSDAVRAWLISELPEPDPEEGFLGRMIHEGKIHYITGELIPKAGEERLFHYSEEQLGWCRDNEKAMWKYLAEQKVLFSSDRLTIRRFLEEAPFTRDFGNQSPGKVGTWIGYRIVGSYMKATGGTVADLIKISGAKEILSAAKYHP